MITHTHIHTQVHKHTLAYTLDSSLYTRTSTHPHPIHPMCVHIGVYESMRESVWRTGSQSTMFVVNKRERERTGEQERASFVRVYVYVCCFSLSLALSLA